MNGMLTGGLGSGTTALFLGPHRLHITEYDASSKDLRSGSGTPHRLHAPVTQSVAATRPTDDDNPHSNTTKRRYVFTVKCQDWIHDIELTPVVGRVTPIVNISPFEYNFTVSME